MANFAGSFLVARPILKDPTFNQTVVLLLQHGEEGAFGLVVNRPAQVEGVPFPVFTGGPCGAKGMILLHGQAEWVDAISKQAGNGVAPGIYLGDSSSLERVSNAPPTEATRFRIFVGYAGWGPDQLEGELAAGAWAVVPASGDILFETPAEDLWSNLIPPSIPQPSMN